MSDRARQEAEEKVEFLEREVVYNQQVHHALTNIKIVNELLDQVEQARDDHRVLESLNLLESKTFARSSQYPSLTKSRILDGSRQCFRQQKLSRHEIVRYESF